LATRAFASCLSRIGCVSDVVSFDDAVHSMTSNLHDDRLLHASEAEISNSGSEQIMEEQSM
jgi:hypothetical protein